MCGRHTQNDVYAEEQQLLFAFPSFQDIDLVEGIQQAMSPLEEEQLQLPLFQDTDMVGRLRKISTLTSLPFFHDIDWVEGIRQTMSPEEEQL